MRETERDTHTERQRERETEIDRQRETKRQTDRETHRQTDRQTDRQTNRDKEGRETRGKESKEKQEREGGDDYGYNTHSESSKTDFFKAFVHQTSHFSIGVVKLLNGYQVPQNILTVTVSA